MITDESLMAYLDGEAAPDQARAIDAALGVNPALRARLAALEARDQTVRAAFDQVLDRPVPTHLVDAVRKAATPDVIPLNLHRQGRTSVVGGAFAVLRRRPLMVAATLAAQAAVIAVTATVALSLQGPATPTARPQYVALGAAPQATTANLMIIFDPATPERDMRGVLSGLDARIVGGPTAAGAYLVQTPADGRDAAVASLQARDDVILAQPIDEGRR